MKKRRNKGKGNRHRGVRSLSTFFSKQASHRAHEGSIQAADINVEVAPPSPPEQLPLPEPSTQPDKQTQPIDALNEKGKEKSALASQNRLPRLLEYARTSLRLLLWPVRKRNLLFTSLLLLCTLFLYSFFYFRASASTDVSGVITQLGDIEFTYNKFQSEGLSPLCGCFRDVNPDEWRGITFAARYIQIERTGELPSTGYLITAALPDKTSWMPALFGLKGTLYSISLPAEEEFDPKFLLDPGQHNYEILSKRNYESADLLMMISNSPLRLALLGDKPIGSWIPADGSKVWIKNEPSRRLSIPTIATIEETYGPYRPEIEGKNLRNQQMGLPLGDFLGPNIVAWMQDGSPVITTSHEVETPNIKPQNGKQVVTAFVVTPPFSLRVAVMPLQEELIKHYVNDMKDPNHQHEFSIPMAYRDSGKVWVSVVDPEKQTADFDEIYKRMKEGEIINTYNNPTIVSIEGKRIGPIGMSFRYPPIPPNKGFNIFGTISSLKINNVTGNLIIGTRQIPIPAPSILELRGIQSLNPEADAISIPLRVESKNNNSELQIRATSEVFLNNVPLNKRSDQYGITDFAALISMIGTLASAGAALWGLRKGRA